MKPIVELVDLVQRVNKNVVIFHSIQLQNYAVK